MKQTNTVMYVLIAVLALGLAYFAFFKKSETVQSEGTSNSDLTDRGGAEMSNIGGTNCIHVPDNIPPYSSYALPSEAQTYLGIANSKFTDAFKARLLGFFVAIDVQPTNERMKYFGAATILKYLDTPNGQLPHWDVAKGSMRCQTVAGFSKFLF